MARPNGRGGWDLTDEDVAEIAALSFGEDEPPKPNLRLKYKARILKLGWERKEFVKDVDGHWYWWPEENRGMYSEADLECIASLLKDANRLLNKELDEYFRAQETSPKEPQTIQKPIHKLTCNCRGGPHGGYTDPNCR